MRDNNCLLCGYPASVIVFLQPQICHPANWTSFLFPLESRVLHLETWRQAPVKLVQSTNIVPIGKPLALPPLKRLVSLWVINFHFARKSKRHTQPLYWRFLARRVFFFCVCVLSWIHEAHVASVSEMHFRHILPYNTAVYWPRLWNTPRVTNSRSFLYSIPTSYMYFRRRRTY